jgi:ectoine hydroxylase-related dioxygenase (phytanoyl-CoA dioxygenase family)
MATTEIEITSDDRADRFRVSVEQYRDFHRDGFLVIRDLVPREDIDELRAHTEDLMLGRLPEQHTSMDERDTSADSGLDVQEAFAAPPEHLSPEEKAQYFLRVHMLHRKVELHERMMLHPRVLDAMEALIGPDVLALSTMLFLKPPGKPGQGWHQDSYYIPTHPDTLAAAWIAIDACDELNGAMWFGKGSGTEPIYPPSPSGYGFSDHTMLDDIHCISGASDPDDEHNDLSPVAGRYDHILAAAAPGDVVFFNGHVFHRSKLNATTDRFRRAFVTHYCNARSFTQWGAEAETPPDSLYAAPVIDPETRMTNGSHILCRGDTHLPFAKPRFGTPCAALHSPEERRRNSEYALRMLASADSLLGCAVADPTLDDDD